MYMFVHTYAYSAVYIKTDDYFSKDVVMLLHLLDMVTKLPISKLVKSAYKVPIAVISRKVWLALLDHKALAPETTHTTSC